MTRIQNNIKICALLLLFTLSSWSVALAQVKLGYFDSMEVLGSFPQIKSADDQLLALQQTRQKEGEVMLTKLQQMVADAQKKVDTGTLSPVQIQQLEKDISTYEKTISDFDGKVTQELADKRKELYAPLLKRVDDVVATVAKENGYNMIFDLSSGFLLYGKPEFDVTALIKKKLGY